MLEEILRKSQKELMKFLRERYKNEGIFYKKGKYLFVKGNIPALLIAHLDTVHKEKVKFICKSEDNNILMSPQGIGGDDRCGVFSIMTLYDDAKKGEKPYLLFTCDEETGGLGAKKFCEHHKAGRFQNELKDIKIVMEFDRKGKDDAVFYDCDNIEFEDYILSKGFMWDYGTFSDICLIAPQLGIAAVNLSCGYYNAHTQHEYINIKELYDTIEKAKDILSDVTKKDFPQFKYIERKYKNTLGSQYNFTNYDYYDWKSDEDYKEIISMLPEKYRQMYDELLDLYTLDEMEDMRYYYGDDVITELYKQEYGEDALIYLNKFNKSFNKSIVREDSKAG